MALREDLPPPLPTRQDSGVMPDYMAPDDMENQLLGPKPEQPAPPPPQKVMVADASGSVATPDTAPPLPARDPRQEAPLANPEPAASGQPNFKFVKPDDSRYLDEQWLIMNYVLTAGALPWMQATTDVAAGRVPPEQFDEVRKEHSLRTEEIIQKHPEFVQAAQKAAPFISGLGLGIMKPAGTIAGTVARGMGAGATIGAVQGFTGGDPNEPTLSRERAVGAAEGAVTGGVMGAAGAGAAAAGRGIVKGAREVGRLRSQDRANREASDAADARREAARSRAASRQDELKQAQSRQTELADSFQQYKKVPSRPAPDWQKKRALFQKDPGRLVDKYYEQVPDGNLRDFSQHLNLPQAVIAQKLSKFDFNPMTPGKIRLVQDVDKILQAKTAFQAQAKATKTAKTPAAPRTKATPTPEPTPKISDWKIEGSTPYRGPALERAKKARGLD